MKKVRMLQLISANPQYTRERGFEYIKLDELDNDQNPIIGRVVFSFRKWE